jgi:CspA family cold shock protein
MKGTIVRKRDEGYGFIKPEYGEKDVFFHASSLADGVFVDLTEGDAVTFDVEQGPKGPAATNVQKVVAAPATDDNASAADDAAGEDDQAE